MSAQTRSTSLLGSAVIAGIIGGILVDLFLSIMFKASPVYLWTGIAATAVGPGTSWWIGFVVHFIISIVWAVLYLFVFRAIGQLRNWIVGAIVWGVVVDAVMQALVVAKTGGSWWTNFASPIGLTAHIVFFALPITLYLARAARRA
jgi:hypothetical protein